MRLASYSLQSDTTASVFNTHANAMISANDDLRMAWVEPDGSLVDALQAYQWDCQKRGIGEAGEWVGRLQRLEVLLQDWRSKDRFKIMSELRQHWLDAIASGDEMAQSCRVASHSSNLGLPFSPLSFRDFYAFEQHVKTARARRGLDMVPEWYEFPVFYFSNPRSFRGPGTSVYAPAGSTELDFELEVACVIGHPGESISVKAANQHIAGLVLLNDWSARDLQRAEMKVGLGPAKGKDFATSFGPYFVTLDELQDVASESGKGVRYDLPLQAAVNNRTISKGNLKDLYYTFEEMIERASRDVLLMPGEVLGSGTVGTGCILELGTEVQPWLVPGDTVRFEAGPLGVLETRVAPARDAYQG